MSRTGTKSSSATILKARELRKSQTESEEIIWQYLRNRLFKGLKFRRQYPIGIYITDFYCPEKKLIVEIDGKIHNKKEQRIWDEDRENNLRTYDYKIIRFKNSDVLNNIEKVLIDLSDFIDRNC